MVLSMGATRWVRDTAVARGWVRSSESRHHTHRGPVPRLGGVGIFAAFSVSLALLVLGYYLIHHNPVYITDMLERFAPPALLIFFVGLADDVYDIPAFVKFSAQIMSALFLFSTGLRVNPHIFGGHETGTVMSLIFTVLWVVGITNAFNLIDGLDGLAAGSALFSTVAVFIVGLIAGDRTMAIITVGLTGAIFGFLRFNFIPATIFLGDSGSLFIGFMLSAISLAGSQKSPTLVAVGIPVVACGLPIFDTGVAIVRRFLTGMPIFGADKEHIHHKLLRRGLTQKQAVVILYGISAGCAFLSLFLLYPGAGTAGVVLVILGIGAWFGLQQLDYRELAELKRFARRAADRRRILANNVAILLAVDHLSTADNRADVIRHLEEMFAENDFDGFELRLNEEGDSSRHLWQRAEATDDKGRWKIQMELRSQSGKSHGELTIFRYHSQKPVLVDIELLTSSLVTALSDSLDRVKAGSPHNVEQTI